MQIQTATIKVKEDNMKKKQRIETVSRKRNGYEIKFIPWTQRWGTTYLWNITVQKEGSRQMLDVELHCKQIPYSKMDEIMEFMLLPGRTPDEVKNFINKKMPLRKCHVFKVTLSEEGRYECILEKSKGAYQPELFYPGTRQDAEM